LEGQNIIRPRGRRGGGEWAVCLAGGGGEGVVGNGENSRVRERPIALKGGSERKETTLQKTPKVERHN